MTPDTKQRILDAAEKLIAERGYAATSLRQIIAEAGVNLAAVHYHFGSKDEVLGAVIERKVGPVNATRMERLAAYEAEAKGKPVSVRKIFDAFLTPMGQAAGTHPQFVRVMGRVVAEGLLPTVLEKNFPEVQARFFGALRRSTQHLTEAEFEARIQFLIGVVSHTMCGSGVVDGFETRVERMIRFLTGGFSAPGEGERK
jgi:AcrR family transcriptional regulator